MTPRAGLLDRAALRVLQTGAVAVVLAAAPLKAFDLDRFFVPKELVLHVTAVLATTLLLVRARRFALGRADQLVGLFLLLSTASALFATNWWWAGRALAVSLSGAACFWCARALARAGFGRDLLSALALAGVIGGLTALLQAYGVRTEYVSLNRAPGGTFGNRNFVAHICAIAIPALVYVATTAPTRRSFVGWAFGTALVSAALILSRSRAAWLALLIGAVILVPCVFMALTRGRGTLRLRRLLALPVAAVLGGYAALVLPNTLDWRSDSPYMDTARSVVNYRQGSGHGRLIQYNNSLRMTLRHPLFGVGPGNWAVVYPRYASNDDPSLADDGTTANPWPSSDWVAFLSERGPAAFVVLALAMLALAVDAIRAVRGARTPEERLGACALLATIAIVLVVGAFDAVLLLPAPALIAWSLIGALSAPSRERAAIDLPWILRPVVIAAAALIGALAVLHSYSQLSAMSLFNNGTRATQLERASTLDPGSYRIHVRLAQSYLLRGNCGRARAHAQAAHALLPNADKPRRLLDECRR